MANTKVATSVQDVLNRAFPGAKYSRLGDLLVHLIDNVNALRAANVTLLAKLDADAGVTDTNYTSLCTPQSTVVSGAITAITTLENRST